mmetsp:Transcript_2841/g.4422  ORF Transcript_2841/g.4422 Transcript_2841/m.4422 type:complete len:219 (+) Transcript_2841:207-863(+)
MMQRSLINSALALLCCCNVLLTTGITSAYSVGTSRTENVHQRSTTRTPFKMMPVETPTREKTDRKTGKKTDKRNNDKDRGGGDEGFVWRRDGPLEYLQDMFASREDDDPFHILLMGATFDKPKITVPYVASSLEYVLEMPPLEATELTTFAYEHGMSCLGTWSHEECLSLAKQIQVRDIVCRVVPYAEGGNRGWQAKDSSDGASKESSNSSGGWGGFD